MKASEFLPTDTAHPMIYGDVSVETHGTCTRCRKNPLAQLAFVVVSIGLVLGGLYAFAVGQGEAMYAMGGPLVAMAGAYFAHTNIMSDHRFVVDTGAGKLTLHRSRFGGEALVLELEQVSGVELSVMDGGGGITEYLLGVRLGPNDQIWLCRDQSESKMKALHAIFHQVREKGQAAALVNVGSETLVDQLLGALKALRFDDADSLLRLIRERYQKDPNPAVARSMAVALECYIDSSCGAGSSEPQRVTRLLSEFCSMLDPYPGEREVRRAYSTMAATVSIYLYHLRDDAILAFHLNKLQRCVTLSPGDEDIAFNVARGMINLTIVRTGRLGDGNVKPAPIQPAGQRPADAIVGDILDTLAMCRASVPQSSNLLDACSRFQHSTGIPVPPAN